MKGEGTAMAVKGLELLGSQIQSLQAEVIALRLTVQALLGMHPDGDAIRASVLREWQACSQVGGSRPSPEGSAFLQSVEQELLALQAPLQRG